ncbi:hypothetical protein L6452_09065 [Arctium lappa]|uniref:Uncharacterized protein n=1 Tax=Arctium lappa TaxID=4217 RepID=A0ACB9DJB1_ARCLA|nr:hypothetical protein L6452_09065 [Arctium lappa]
MPKCVLQMATQAASPDAILPSAQVVGNAFVEQYYHILHQSPELVHKFYQDSTMFPPSSHDELMLMILIKKEVNGNLSYMFYSLSRDLEI